MTVEWHIPIMAAIAPRQTAILLNKEPMSAYTHFAGLAAALVGVVPLLMLSAGDATRLVGMSLYSGSLVLLFLASSAYHYVDLGERGNLWLQRVDHGAIFLFIAGTYISPLLCTLDGAWRMAMVAIVGSIALGGVILKFAWIDCPRWLSVALYLGMGWIVVLPGYHVLPRLAIPGFSWLVIGGLSYTVGAIVYAREGPDLVPGRFVYHDLGHLFVLGGAASHYVFMLFSQGSPSSRSSGVRATLCPGGKHEGHHRHALRSGLSLRRHGRLRGNRRHGSGSRFAGRHRCNGLGDRHARGCPGRHHMGYDPGHDPRCPG